MPIDTRPLSSLTGQPIGRLQGTGTQQGSGAFGAVPTVPSPAGTQAAAIGGNIGNLGSLYGLTGSLNTQIAQQAALPYQLNLPNYGAMTGQSSGNILSQLQGQVPQDVSNQLQQMAAERGISTGSIGSPNANTALLRSLGLTSLGLQQQGEQNLTGAIQRTPTGQQFNPQSFLVTPQQQQEAQYLASLYQAAPNPAAAAHAGLKEAQSGLAAGLGSGFRPYGGGGGGMTDALGFPIDMFGGGGSSAMNLPTVAGGALGTPSAPTENVGAWNTWNQSMPWNQPQQPQPSFDTDASWMENYGAGTPVGTIPTSGGDQWMNDPFGGYGGQFAGAYDEGMFSDLGG